MIYWTLDTVENVCLNVASALFADKPALKTVYESMVCYNGGL